MKRTILLLALVVGGLSLASSQFLVQYSTTTVINNKTYANSQTDTSGATSPASSNYQVYTLGGVNRLSYAVQYGDSISLVVKFRYRVKGNTTWTAVAAAAGDTVVDTGNAGFYQVTLRDNVTERIPGVDTELMIINAFAASANSANSGATYTTRLKYR